MRQFSAGRDERRWDYVDSVHGSSASPGTGAPRPRPASSPRAARRRPRVASASSRHFHPSRGSPPSAGVPLSREEPSYAVVETAARRTERPSNGRRHGLGTWQGRTPGRGLSGRKSGLDGEWPCRTCGTDPAVAFRDAKSWLGREWPVRDMAGTARPWPFGTAGPLWTESRAGRAGAPKAGHQRLHERNPR